MLSNLECLESSHGCSSRVHCCLSLLFCSVGRSTYQGNTVREGKCLVVWNVQNQIMGKLQAAHTRATQTGNVNAH